MRRGRLLRCSWGFLLLGWMGCRALSAVRNSRLELSRRRSRTKARPLHSSRVGIPRLKSPFRAKPLADFSDLCFASLECLPARMYGVGAEHQVVGVLDGRTKD